MKHRITGSTKWQAEYSYWSIPDGSAKLSPTDAFSKCRQEVLGPVADLGFPRQAGRPTPKVGTKTIILAFFPKTAWHWKQIGPRRGAHLWCSLHGSASGTESQIALSSFLFTFQEFTICCWTWLVLTVTMLCLWTRFLMFQLHNYLVRLVTTLRKIATGLVIDMFMIRSVWVLSAITG